MFSVFFVDLKTKFKMFFMISIYYFDFPRGLELIIFMHMYAWFAWLHALIRGCVRPCVL